MNNELTIEELDYLVRQKQTELRALKKRNRTKYETFRDATIEQLVQKATELSAEIVAFKQQSSLAVAELYKQAIEYGTANPDNQGNATFKTKSLGMGVKFSTRKIMEYDERAEQATALIRDFLSDKVKRKDKAIYDLVISLIEKDQDGKLSPANIQKLYLHEDKFDDERWTKALELYKESYVLRDTCPYISFMHTDKQGKWVAIPLSFSKV